MTYNVTVLSRDGQTVLAHWRAVDAKEVQGICTIARSADHTTHIWIKPPAGLVYGWDEPTAAELKAMEDCAS